VKSITARVAYAGDQFEVRLGTDEGITHIPALTGRGDAIAVYAIATLDTGAQAFDFMAVEDVEKIRTRSKSGNSGPWRTDWEEMARKTVVRRLCKYLPLSPELAGALDADEAMTGHDRRTGEVVLQHAGEVIEAETVQLADERPADRQTGDHGDGQPDPATVAKRVLAALPVPVIRKVIERGTGEGAADLDKEALLKAVPHMLTISGWTYEDFMDAVNEAKAA
jgi:recombinational DNA repair protein RecT